MARGKARRTLKRLLIMLIVVGVVIVGLAAFRVGPAPDISVQAGLPGIGKRTPITVRVQESGRGLGGLRVEFVQGDRVELLAEREHRPLEPWQFWGARTKKDQLELEVGRATLDGLQEGQAAIRVTAERAGSWLRRPRPAVEELVLPVKLRPPTLQVTSTHTYVAQGGSEAVVYRIGESAVTDGVQAGEWFFPGYPLPGGGERDRFALFAAPYDLEDSSPVRLVAEDDVENQVEVAFIDRFHSRPMKLDRVQVTDSFIDRVVPALMSATPELRDRGSLLENYLEINGELREANARTLRDLAKQTRAEFLWRRPFRQLPNSQVTSAFADRRTYFHDGREIDRQDHLGFDLASVSRAEVPAANDGVVLLARYLGIYGNTVVIDHGYGLQSLYGHLSSLNVEEGQEVGRGDVLGRTGDTGLAGGDHLHFTMMLQGLPVNPREWWDGHWIHDRIKLKLGDAFPFEE